MKENDNKARSSGKGDKLRSALRDNLKKRKGQVRKLGQSGDDEAGFGVKLRLKEIPRSSAPVGKSDSHKNSDNK